MNLFHSIHYFSCIEENFRILKIIATRLNQYRINQNLIFDSLSEKTGIDPTYLSRDEHGEINITAKTLDKLLNGLNVTASEFFRDTDIILKDQIWSCFLKKFHLRIEKMK